MPSLLAIALLSAAALGYEVLLLRLFAIIQWHHFAYMIISLALLGYGASGTFLAFMGRYKSQRFPTLFAVNAVLFGFSAILCFLIAQQLPFNPLELLWDWHQLVYLAIMYLVLAIPFFFAANGIGISFYSFRKEIGAIYSADLIGAGVGAVGVVLLLFLVSPVTALKIIGILGLISATLCLWQSHPSASPLWKRSAKSKKGGWLAAMLLAAAGLAILFKLVSGSLANLQMSPYKGLSQTLQNIGSQVLTERSNPLGLLTVVESPSIPFRYAPGLSLNSPVEPPLQLGVFTDGDAFTAITRYQGQPATLSYLDFMTSALPYQLLKQPHVLILGAGGGSGILQALYHNARQIDAVELNREMVRLVKQDYANFAGRIYEDDKVQIHLAEARGLVSKTQNHYDLIQVTLLDSFGAASAGLYALSENYLYTVESLEQLFARLSDNGLLAITRWLKLPPRDSLKLFATAIKALQQAGIDKPGEHLALIRGWKTSTLLIKKTGFTQLNIQQLQRFCQQRFFDVAYYPGISALEPNRYNLLDHPYFYEGTLALLGDQSEHFIANYKYDIAPATDDQPYFFNFFKWSLLAELFAKRGSGGMGLLEWGYPVLIAALGQAIVFSIILILLPLWIKVAQVEKSKQFPKVQIFIYFLAIGFAFLFIEMAFIQKFILFLSHPLYAIAVVLCAFLIFAGLGSFYSSRWLNRFVNRFKILNPSVYATTGIIMVALLYLILLSPLLQWLIFLPDILKVIISLLLIAPLAFWMGMPFPLGLSRLGEQAPSLIPWAWAINGCASVISAILATVLAIHFGFTVVILLAMSLYGIAALSYPQPKLMLQKR